MCLSNSSMPASARAIIKFLNCPCVYFPPMEDDDPIMTALETAKAEGHKSGFIPVLIAADEILWECFMTNTKAGENGYAFSQSCVDDYKNNMLSSPVENGLDVFSRYISEDKSCQSLNANIVSDAEGIDRFYGYWDYSTEKTCPLILAKIPVTNPWEIFAYIPFGGQNQAPSTKEIMSISKYWFEKYNAVPAVITRNVLEFYLEQPIRQSDAVELAIQQMSVCPDIADQGFENISTTDFAATLALSKVWYFCW